MSVELVRRAQRGDRVAFDVVLACSEAFANAVEHPLAPAAGQVEVRGTVSDDTVTVTIRDYGLWRENSQQGGRGHGFRMMRGLMDAVQVDAGPEGTSVTLRKRLEDTGNGKVT